MFDDGKLGNWEIKRVLISVFDTATVAAAWPLAILIRNNFAINPVYYENFIFNEFLLITISCLLYWLFGLHRSLWRYASASNLLAVGRWVTTVVLVFTLAAFLIDRLEGIARSVVLIHWLLAAAILWGTRILYICVCHPESGSVSQQRSMDGVKPVLLVGGGDGAALVINIIAQRLLTGQRIIGILDDRVAVGRKIYNISVLGRLEDFDIALHRLAIEGINVEQLIVTSPHHELGRETMNEMMRKAEERGIEVVQLPDLLKFKDEPAPAPIIIQFDEAKASMGEKAGLYPAFKRGLDVFISGLVLTLASPFALLFAIGIRMQIGQTILFNQVRPGRQMRTFTLHKFRSMRDAVAAKERFAGDVERTPWFGRLLRRSRLDELPQLFNVLIGDMSLIGPRPLLPADMPTASPEAIRLRCSVRPGITGWAQVNGGHQLDAEQKLALDLWYIENRGVLLDTKILILTLRMMIFGEKVNEGEIARARQSFENWVEGNKSGSPLTA